MVYVSPWVTNLAGVGLKILAIGIVGLVLLGAGCARPVPPDPGTQLAPMHKEQFDLALQGVVNPDKYHKMMEDYWISDEEWNEAVNDFLSCAEAQGTEGIVEENVAGFGLSPRRQQELYQIYPDKEEAKIQLDKEDEIVWDCGTQTVLRVNTLYFGPRNNPDGLMPGGAIRRCFQELDDHSLDGLTDNEVQELIMVPGHFTSLGAGQKECFRNRIYGSKTD